MQLSLPNTPVSLVLPMRLFCFIAISFSLMSHLYAQDSSFTATSYLQLAKAIDQDKTMMKKIRLDNEDFLEQALDGGGELTGYYRNRELRKIHCWLGYSWGTDEKYFYFQNNQLVFVRHTNRHFVFDDASDSYRQDSVDAPFTGQYFFLNGTLLHYVITEIGHHFESEKDDIERSVKEEAETWLRVLKKKRPK
jgi:hypothetical protein